MTFRTSFKPQAMLLLHPLQYNALALLVRRQRARTGILPIRTLLRQSVAYSWRRRSMLMWIVARNGGFATSPLVGKYCGATIDRFIRSHSNRIYLKFVSNSFVSQRGFSIRYDGTTSGQQHAVFVNFNRRIRVLWRQTPVTVGETAGKEC